MIKENIRNEIRRQVNTKFVIFVNNINIQYREVWLKVDRIMLQIFANFYSRGMSCIFYDQKSNHKSSQYLF